VTKIIPGQAWETRLEIAFADRAPLTLAIFKLELPGGERIAEGSSIALAAEDYQAVPQFAYAHGWSPARRDLRRKLETWRPIPPVRDLRFDPVWRSRHGLRDMAG